MTISISKEDARLCADVVKEVAHAHGFVNDPVAIGRLTASVARLFNRGMRDRDQLLDAAMQCAATGMTSPSEPGLA
ncbi:hypothetical protein ACQZ6F_29060 [Rhizobium sp. A22-96]